MVLWPMCITLEIFLLQDIEMHRGKPLYLNEERYAALTYMVLRVFADFLLILFVSSNEFLNLIS